MTRTKPRTARRGGAARDRRDEPLVITLEVRGDLRDWLESLERPPAEVVHEHLEAALRRVTYARAVGDEDWVSGALLRYEGLAEEQALKRRRPGQSEQAFQRARQAAQAAARREIKRFLEESPNAVVRAAYVRVQLAERLRMTLGPDRLKLRQELLRLRLERPGGWRGGPRGDLHPQLPRVRCPTRGRAERTALAALAAAVVPRRSKGSRRGKAGR